MISFLCGKLFEKKGERITLLCGNIGFEVRVPFRMIRKIDIEEEVCVHISMVVKQDSLHLYGFETREERELFEKLQHVNNVGPKLAFNMISSLGVDEIAKALKKSNAAVLASVPGIGKKTATRILVELKSEFGEEGLEKIPEKTGEIEQAVEALVKLGYSRNEALTALKEINMDDNYSLEDIVRQAFKKFS